MTHEINTIRKALEAYRELESAVVSPRMPEDAIGALAALELLAKQGWRPISECPKEGDFLVWDGYCCDVVDSGNSYTENGIIHMFNGDIYRKPTHWQPLPPPPKE